MSIELFHKAPEGYSYEIERDFKKNITAIWLRHHKRYDYNLGKPVKTIWGFYNNKKRQFCSPVNSKTVGAVIDISLTTPYTGMKPPKKNPLEDCFG